MNSLTDEEIKELQRIAMMNMHRIAQAKTHDDKGRPYIIYRPKVVDYGDAEVVPEVREDSEPESQS